VAFVFPTEIEIWKMMRKLEDHLLVEQQSIAGALDKNGSGVWPLRHIYFKSELSPEGNSHPAS
jgi:hypothetical protein